MSIFKNGEGYADPTAGSALSHIDYEAHLRRIKRKLSKLENKKNKQVTIRKMMLSHSSTNELLNRICTLD